MKKIGKTLGRYGDITPRLMIIAAYLIIALLQR